MKNILTIISLALTIPGLALAQARNSTASAAKPTPQQPTRQQAPAQQQRQQAGQPRQQAAANQQKQGDKKGPVVIPPPARLQTGIRFVFGMPNAKLNKALMPINKTTFVEVPMRYGLPAARVPYPEDRVLRFYTEIPTKENKLQPFFKTNLPQDVVGKSIGVFCFNGNQMIISYIDEKDCQPGMTYIKNMTGIPILLRMPKAIGSEKDMQLLEPGKEWKFGQTLSKENRSMPLEVRTEKALPNGQKQWFIDRKMMLKTDKSNGNLVLILPHASGNTVQVQTITIYQD